MCKEKENEIWLLSGDAQLLHFALPSLNATMIGAIMARAGNLMPALWFINLNKH